MSRGSSEGAAALWAAALESWAIPEHILDSVTESPWSLSPAILRQRVEEFGDAETPSRRRAWEALPHGGTVLDVGVGAGAGSLPLLSRAGKIVGVDEKPDMLEAFAEEAARRGVSHSEVLGRWPDVAGEVPRADVVVCHHVFYNAPDLGDFVSALSACATHRVVAEITESHPMSVHNDLWLKFHDLRRPTRPTAADAVEVIREAGFDPMVDLWVRPRVMRFESREELVNFVRLRVCLERSRAPELDELLDPEVDVTPRGVATIWWQP